MTIAEKKWLDAICRLGCCVCLRTGLGATPAEVHHVLNGGRKIGDLHTIPLCYRHHRSDTNNSEWVSRHRWRKVFERRYGTELDLLAWTQDQVANSIKQPVKSPMNDPLRIDSHKLHFHPGRVVQLLDGRDDWEKAKEIYPIYVEVSPSGACNHRCTFCAVDYIGYKTIMLDHAIYADRIAEMGALGVKSVMMGGEGEPLLHKKINPMVSATLASGVDVSFTTNGVLLNKLDLHGVSWVKVSLNAGTRDTYAKVHQTQGKDWDAVWRNLKDAVGRAGPCQIGVQMVLLPENLHEAQALQDRCNDIGIAYVVFKPYSQHTFSVTRQYDGFKGIPVVSGKTAVVRKAAIETTEIPYDKCQATPYLWGYVMASGDLYSCSAYLLDERFNLGNINTHSFREIWHGEKRRANWEYVRKHLDIHECRLNCRMDKANRYLDELIKGPPGVNFI